MTAKRPMYFTLDTQGNPQPVIDSLEWARWYEKSWPARSVAQISIPLDRTHRLFVSAAFLSLDHNWFDKDDDRPILYETMVFYEEFNRPHGRGKQRARRRAVVKRMLETPYQRRYHTREEAQDDFNKLLSYLLNMKASTKQTPLELVIEAWCRLYDDFGFRADDVYASSQTENSEEMTHEE